MLSFPPKVRLWLISRVLLGLLNNYAFLTGIKLVSLGKGVMIWSLGPLFCFLVAGLCLGDMIRPLNVVLILASLAGIYLLTINMGNGEVPTSLEYLGYFWLTASACFYGLLYMIFRKMTLYKIHPLISPLYLGIGAVCQTILLALVASNKINFSHYTGGNIVYLTTIGLTCALGNIIVIASCKFFAARKMAAINYAENIFTLPADYFFYGYKFELTDAIGVGVIVLCMAAGAIQKILMH